MSFLPPNEIAKQRQENQQSKDHDDWYQSQQAVRLPSDTIDLYADADGGEDEIIVWSKSAEIAAVIDANDLPSVRQGDLVCIRGLSRNEIERVNSELEDDGEATV